MDSTRDVASRRCESICRQIVSAPCASASPAPKARAAGPPRPRLADFRYIMPSHTRFGDCDMYGHVHNVTYYAYFDTLVNGFLVIHGGMAGADGGPGPIVGLVVASSCQYVASIGFPQRLLFALRVRELGTSSVMFETGVFRVRDDYTHAQAATIGIPSAELDAAADLCAFGTFTHVFVTRDNMRPTPIPPRIRDAITKIVVPLAVPAAAAAASAATTKPAALVPSPVSAAASSGVRQSASCVLMVHPRHFGRNEESASDNSFMVAGVGLSSQEVSARAAREFDAYVALLRAHGVRVEVAHPSPHVVAPDAVFPNNWVSTHAREATRASKLVLYPMRHPSRRLERDAALVQRLRARYETVADFTSWEETDGPNGRRGTYFEGTGAALLDRVHHALYVCRSERADDSLFQPLVEEWWPAGTSRVHQFDAVDANGVPIYHTNVLLAIGTSWAVVCDECILPSSTGANGVKKLGPAEVILALERTGHEVVRITRAQMAAFCANVLEVRSDDTDAASKPPRTFIAMSTRAHNAFTQAQRATLLRHVDALLHTPLDVIENVGGGGARCMLAELF